MSFSRFAFLIAVLAPALAAQPQCSVEQLRGNWSLSSIGWVVPTVPGPWVVGQTTPVVGTGVIVIDHAGRLTGPGVIVIGGVPIDFEMIGTVDVQPDCTGLMKYAVRLKGTPDAIAGYVERIVVDLVRGEMTTVAVKSPLSNPAWVTTAKRISHVPSPVGWPDAGK